MNYIETNMNPMDRNTNDCVVRAIVKATDKVWSETLRALTETACVTYYMPNDVKCYSRYLKECGFTIYKCPRDANGSKMTIRQVFDGTKGTFLVQVSGHLTCVIDGDLYDTWDCRHRCVNRYWRVK